MGKMPPLTTWFNGNKTPLSPFSKTQSLSKILSVIGTIQIIAPENEKEELKIKKRIKHTHLLSHRLLPCNSFGEHLLVLPCISTIYQLCFSDTW